jgi:hypothetical protein
MKTILWSALLAGGLLLGGAAGVNAAPVATVATAADGTA